jgi:hypothetical protein
MKVDDFIDWSIRIIDSCKHVEQVEVARPYLFNRIPFLQLSDEDSSKARHVIDYFSECKSKILFSAISQEKP